MEPGSWGSRELLPLPPQPHSNKQEIQILTVVEGKRLFFFNHVFHKTEKKKAAVRCQRQSKNKEPCWVKQLSRKTIVDDPKN